MKLPSSALEAQQAIDGGYRQLTTPFFLPQERSALDNCMRDMDRGNVDYVLVGSQGSPSVWRKGMQTCKETMTNFMPLDPMKVKRIKI